MQYISDFIPFTSMRLINASKYLSQSYPFVKVFNIGKSVCEKSIVAIKLGSGTPAVMYFAGVHANEYITTTILLRFVSEVCYKMSQHGNISGVNLQSVLKCNSAVFVPLLNPDGCDIVIENGKNLAKSDYIRISEYCGGDFSTLKANFRGVDLNHNFNADWESVKSAEIQAGIVAPTAKTFGGYFPESEPETISAVTAMNILRPKSVIALHTQGQEIYVGYKTRRNDTEIKMAEVFSCLCGYKIAKPSGISFGAGLKDWYSQKYAKPSFTFECGKGTNPLPISDAKSIYDRLRETFSVSLLM